MEQIYRKVVLNPNPIIWSVNNANQNLEKTSNLSPYMTVWTYRQIWTHFCQQGRLIEHKAVHKFSELFNKITTSNLQKSSNYQMIDYSSSNHLLGDYSTNDNSFPNKHLECPILLLSCAMTKHPAPFTKLKQYIPQPWWVNPIAYVPNMVGFKELALGTQQHPSSEKF